MKQIVGAEQPGQTATSGNPPVRLGRTVLSQASPLPTPAADGTVVNLICDEYGRPRMVVA